MRSISNPHIKHATRLDACLYVSMCVRRAVESEGSVQSSTFRSSGGPRRAFLLGSVSRHTFSFQTLTPQSLKLKSPAQNLPIGIKQALASWGDGLLRARSAEGKKAILKVFLGEGFCSLKG